jgi:hypothetical protein
MAVPYLVYLLSHHPDMTAVRRLAAQPIALCLPALPAWSASHLWPLRRRASDPPTSIPTHPIPFALPPYPIPSRPAPQDPDDPEMAKALAPFQHMLQAALAPLLAPAQAGAGAPAASLPLLLKMLARMKGTEDSAVRRWRGLLRGGVGAGVLQRGVGAKGCAEAAHLCPGAAAL